MPYIRLCERLEYDDFLNLDGPTGEEVLPNDPKEKFFRHLGMSEHSNRHLELYSTMKREATEGMRRLFANRDCLEPEFVSECSVQPPFSHDHINEDAFQREVDKIYESSSGVIKGIYDMTWTPKNRNWVVRWMLWRVIWQAQEGRSEQTDVSTAPPSSSLPLSTLQHGTSPSPHKPNPDQDCSAPKDKVMNPAPEVVSVKPPHRSSYWDLVLNT